MKSPMRLAKKPLTPVNETIDAEAINPMAAAPQPTRRGARNLITARHFLAGTMFSPFSELYSAYLYLLKAQVFWEWKALLTISTASLYTYPVMKRTVALHQELA